VGYFCKYLSVGAILEAANPSHGDKNSSEDGFYYFDWTAARMQSWPRVGERFDLRPKER
jgi:hypothetical protein